MKEHGKMESTTAKASLSGLMDHPTRGTTSMVRKKGREPLYMLPRSIIREIGKTEFRMVKERCLIKKETY